MRLSRQHRRRGWTLIELAIAMAVLAVMATVALTNIDFNRWRLDAQARLVVNQLLAAQSLAVQKNMQILVTFYYNQGQFQIVEDANASGHWDTGEKVHWRTLDEGMEFISPPSTVDGDHPYYATGPGLTYLNQTYHYPTVTFYANGSSSGNIVVYVASKTNRPAPTDYRAVQVTGATSKATYWRRMADGSWHQANM